MKYTLSLFQQFYWKDKLRFDMRSSRYPSWVMFAVEKGGFQYQIEAISGSATAGDNASVASNSIRATCERWTASIRNSGIGSSGMARPEIIAG